MAFNALDIYTVDTGAERFNYWNPFVTKHDSKSFYNWEQDNLPLYDLDERTGYLWEKLGWPTSSIPGLAMAVSSTIPTQLSLSSNVFTSLQDAVDSLPLEISFPVLIEVAASGNLGSLRLENIKFTGNGALEIVNRVFAEFEGTSISNAIDQASGIVRIVESSEATAQIASTSSLYLGTTTSHLWPGGSDKWDGMAFVAEHEPTDFVRPDRCSTVIHNNVANSWITGGNYLTPDAKDSNSIIGDGSVATLDWDSSSLNNAIELSRYAGYDGTLNAGGSVVGFMTNNHLESIKVTNCGGPIYIRGFTVDGKESTDWGINISNCNNVYLENCGVSRSQLGGLKADSSKIFLNRRFCSNRNYNSASRGYDNYGIYASNSELEVTTDSYVPNDESLFSFQEQAYGIYLLNSTLKGGSYSSQSDTTWLKCSHSSKAGIKAVNSKVALRGFIDAYSNEVGIDLVSSELEIDGLICELNRMHGINSRDSHITYGINSSPPVGSFPTTSYTKDGIAYGYLVGFFANGMHLNLENSTYKPVRRENMHKTHWPVLYASHNGISVDRTENPVESRSSILPAFRAVNSTAEFIHSRISTANSHTDETHFYPELYTTQMPSFGVILDSYNSSVKFLGSGDYATVITGPCVNNDDCGIYLNSNSKCIISGPSHISQFGTSFLADNNSNLVFCPHYNQGSFTYDDEFGLSSTSNHTSVEVHAYSRCMVADKNSTITMRDLGHALDRYPSNFEQASATDFKIEYSVESSTITGGGMVLLPNPFESPSIPGQVTSYQNKLSYRTDPTNFKFSQTAVNGYDYGYYLEDLDAILPSNYRSRLSKGGICVQAINNSTINAQNVCFMTGPENTDWPYYDYLESPAGCSDLKIWAVSNGSILNANTLAVSGLYPSLAGYVGPSALWHEGGSYAMSAYSHQPYDSSAGHPDVSTLSVLDFFGIGEQVPQEALSERYQAWSDLRWGGAKDYFGVSSSENSGPFRIYMDVAPEAKGLSFFSSVGGYTNFDNRPYQLMAQGYSLSGPCASQEDIAAAMFGQLLTLSSTLSSFESSGYYETSSFVSPSRVTVTLDESAANTFANAKHCSIPFLGRDKLVNIYRATNKAFGEAYTHSNSGYGAGFKGTNIFDLRRNL